MTRDLPAVADLTRPAATAGSWRIANLRLTVQASNRNKFNLFWDEQHPCQGATWGENDEGCRQQQPGQIIGGAPGQAFGMPLLQLERLTFRFVEAGFVVLTATLLLGVITTTQWRQDLHKTVFSVLAWGVFAALLGGRRWQGWRGRRATRWLYAGAVLLLLAYVGSRFVFEVLLGRTPP